MRTLSITGSFLFIFLFANIAFAQLHYSRQYLPGSEMENTRFKTIFQTHSGLIWAGGDNGVFRFDGIGFRHYANPDSTIVATVTAIGEDAEKHLWFGYSDGSLAFLENDKLLSFQPEEGTPVKAITGIAAKPGGGFWFSTYGEGLYVYTNNRIYNFDEEDGLAGNDIYAIGIDKKGQVWAGTDRGVSICSFEDGTKKVRNLTTADGLPDIIAEDLFVDDNGDVWLAFYDKGICKINGETGEISIPPQVKSWPFGEVKCLAVLDNKALWAGTAESGIIRIDLTDTTRVNPINTYGETLDLSIVDLFKDGEGNIWIIDKGQGLKMINPTFEYLDHEDFRFLNNIQAVFCDRTGHTWLSSSSGLFEYIPDKETDSRFVQHLSSLTGGSVPVNFISLNQDKYGNIWAGSFGNGIYIYDPLTGKYIHFNEKSGIVNDNVLSIAANGNEIWLGTLGGVSKATFSNNAWTFDNYEPRGQLGSSYIYDVLTDRGGKIWFATDGNGLKVLENGSFTTYTEGNGFTFKTVYSITEDESGNIWFSSPASGLFKFNGDTFQNFNQENGLRNIDISGLAMDDQNRLLIIHKAGLDVLDVSTDHINYFGGESGIGVIDGNLNAVAGAPNGDIWIGGQESVIRYQTFREKPHMDPKILINQVHVFLAPVSEENYQFNHTENHISFDYIGIWYTNPEIVRYRHKLEGYDIDWVVSRDRFASYPHLGPGHYKFVVQATADQSFKFTKSAEVHFSIAPPFWRTWWFILIVLLSIAGLLNIWIKTREARLKKEAQAKKEKIEFQLQTLKSQVNPHFLFNSFNTLITIIEEDQEMAVEYVEKLSDFFRSIIQYRETELIPLEEEVTLLKNYYYLLKKRYENNLELQADIPVNGKSYAIPPLTLQLLVENAVKHNVISRNHPLKIEIALLENADGIIVTNNLQRKKNTATSTHFGLDNIDTRFRLLHGKGISIEESENTYTVILPLIKNGV